MIWRKISSGFAVVYALQQKIGHLALLLQVKTEAFPPRPVAAAC
jgi:hypothetical protein